MNRITVVGGGPGGEDGLTMEARRALDGADAVYAAQRYARGMNILIVIEEKIVILNYVTIWVTIQHPGKMFRIRAGSSLTGLIPHIFPGRTRRGASRTSRSPECEAFGTWGA